MEALTPKFPHLLHGGDYNPDQWLDRPDILEEDIRLMKKAHINCVSVGIFAWAKLEPEEGVYDFDWLEKILDRLYENGVYTILATPSGAKPVWMSEKYPEIRRVRADLRHGETGTITATPPPCTGRRCGPWIPPWQSVSAAIPG